MQVTINWVNLNTWIPNFSVTLELTFHCVSEQSLRIDVVWCGVMGFLGAPFKSLILKNLLADCQEYVSDVGYSGFTFLVDRLPPPLHEVRLKSVRLDENAFSIDFHLHPQGIRRVHSAR